MNEQAAPQSYLIRNARIVKPTRVLSGDVVIENGVISCIGEPPLCPGDHEIIDAPGCYVVPGFVDIHCHGGMGLDLTEGEYDPATGAFNALPERYEEGLPRLMEALARAGTTRMLLATVAAPEERLKRCLASLGDYVAGDRNGVDGTRLDGAFIEGTFIRNRAFAGAQNPDYFFEPSIDLVDRLNEAAGKTIRYVNVVPEWGEPAVRLARDLTDRGILVGAGHTEASAEQYMEVVKAGLQVAVHFTNGPTGTSFKPFGGGGGVFQAVLRSHAVMAELICDGFHINPSYVRDIIRRKRPERIIAITDAMFPSGRGDIDTFEVAGIRGRAAEGGRYLAVEGTAQTLFGSLIRMRDAFSNILSWLTRRMPGIWRDEHLPFDTEEAIVDVARMCATNPARALGIFDPASQRLGQDLSGFCGGVQVGKRADLAVIRLDGEPGYYDVAVTHTFVGGRLFTPNGDG